ncbi:hypothetical protein [Pseudidiomarina terrestris]|uniref:Uncharacterized protein n=1 Tax=Pseudidiomarina terrestris TaxID=2820060 RepID=A0AAW7QZY2_9GAMM|nr:MULTISPECIES: hypothetical protein [unclassified Pseudidiomarina]MDN7124584.1 hypothetical protein [Pseudidiomarina sp. 1APP75-32.1]MDN7129125.1 hypothetical protein [Pseudidiomarina sp. 1APR75-15]MDN7134611.1 hypothetical protein [Pseudidiomarina sp. 1ASP75-5]MEA3587601.1 hypothetical protein [Pseudidiomarina sp. 1APP75-27a]
MKYLIAGATLALLAGCNGPSEEPLQSQPTAAAEDPQAQMAGLDQQIRSMIGMAYADNLEQCRLAEVGHRPCGGPQYYIAYSTTTVDEAVLQKLIAEHRQLQINYQQRHDVVGTCEVIPRPQLTMQGGRCIASPTAER